MIRGTALVLILLVMGCTESPEQKRSRERQAKIDRLRQEIEIKTEAAAHRIWSEQKTPADVVPTNPVGKPATNLSEGIRSGMESLATEAFVAGQNAIKRKLKAPSTAEFSSVWNGNTGWQAYGFHQWKVFGYVDAQNSFGARLRQNWMAVVKWEGGSMQTIWARLGEDASGPMPGIRAAPPLRAD